MMRLLALPFLLTGWALSALLRRRRRRKLSGAWAEIDIGGRVLDGPEPSSRVRELIRRLRGGGDDRTVELRALRRALRDIDAPGLLVRWDDPELDWTGAEGLRAALAEVRALGREVVFFSPSPIDNLGALVASGASRVAIGPAGGWDATGSRSRGLFLRALLDRIGVRAQTISAGAYKSAPDALTRTERSDADREQIGAILARRDNALVKGLAEGRRVERERAVAMLEAAPLGAGATVEAGLADAVLRDEALPGWIAHAVNEGRSAKIESLSAHAASAPRSRPRRARRPRIAVIRVHGAIVDAQPRIPSDSAAVRRAVVDQIRAAHAHPRVEGAVLDVNSGGGSVVASDVIFGALRALAADKPLAATMGGAAASGGYYVACAAHRVVAHPLTLTGSIGVFGVLPAWPELLRRIGVHADAVHTLAMADIGDPARLLTDDERARLQRRVDDLYRGFVDLVAERRGLERAAVEAAAGGRVWTGADALERGLVDALGSFDDAFDWVAHRIGRPVEPEPMFAKVKGHPPRPEVPAGAVGGIGSWLPDRSSRELLALATSGARAVAWTPLLQELAAARNTFAR